MSNVLITGAAGFLGLHIATIFQNKGHQIIATDIAPFFEDEYPEGTRFYTVDVRQEDMMRSILRENEVDIVVHGAAALPLWKKQEIMDINIQGTEHMLKASKDAEISRFVHISSTAVYGVPKVHPLKEDFPVHGVGPYGISKIKAEELCQKYRSDDFCVSMIRPKTFIGTGRLGVFQILYDWVHSGKRIPVIGNGHNRYQLLEVEDLVEAIHLCATGDQEAANDTFNVGAKEFQTVREDVGALCDYAGNGARVQGTPAWVIKPGLALFEAMNLSPLYKWVYGTADKDSFVSTDLITEKLGWQPQYSNSQALIRSYQWYLDNMDSIDQGTGVTHRIAWDQGILGAFKKVF